ncbi:AAA family ATPase [Mechercharimyces sp. CAU 1602]|uniref:AAA family ATPase n=1 Tax=Mechercharimyces sp. CAU 1602 TaxID=2973933 RepID=UPI0021638614|nr:AAA family ATPase [Mechercharimyces sp. CAU 1602]MCS1350349.1 AAA family ATPase [Mechercharimyces sp. CAU 1602]
MKKGDGYVPNAGMKLFSKVIDSNDPKALVRFGVEEYHLATESEKKAYRFVQDYAEKNRGTAPDFRTVAEEVEGFEYHPNVGDDYEYLVREIKSHSAKQFAQKMLQDDAVEKFSEYDGESFINWLISEAEKIKMKTNVRADVGTSVKYDSNKFLEEYKKRKLGESLRIWKSVFPTINNEIGGYFSGNLYTWYARSGRGKSVITKTEALNSAFQGANVLFWGMEMARFEIMARLYSMISAREGIFNKQIDGLDYECGFDNRALLMATLTEEFEQGLETFLSVVHEMIPGNLIIRAADDEDFIRRDLRQLEADIIETEADVVVIDPFYYLDYEANTTRTAGGDAANTSKKLRQLAGRTKTVIHAITQSEEIRNDKDDDGNRLLKAPSRAEIKKTKAVLEDATNTFGIDTLDGRGIIDLGKGRNGGEGAQVELIYLPNYGIVREVPMGDEAGGAGQFEF